MPHQEKKELVAVYGTLMKGYDGQRQAGVNGKLSFVGKCVIRGILLDIGEYPGLVPGHGKVAGELCEVPQSLLPKLDSYEEYDPEDKSNSLFVRKFVRLIDPPKKVWVYFFNKDRGSLPRIQQGVWRNQNLAGGR